MQTLRLQAGTAIIALALIGGCCHHPKRDPAMRSSFMASTPCPANNNTRGPCPGYQVDHIKPLCAGGKDAPENMQWLTTEAHLNKTKTDVAICRRH